MNGTRNKKNKLGAILAIVTGALIAATVLVPGAAAEQRFYVTVTEATYGIGESEPVQIGLNISCHDEEGDPGYWYHDCTVIDIEAHWSFSTEDALVEITHSGGFYDAGENDMSAFGVSGRIVWWDCDYGPYEGYICHYVDITAAEVVLW